MTVRRIPPDAFEYYVSLGEDRSYQSVADHYSFTKRAIQNLATRQDWPGRLERIDRESRGRIDKRLGETLDEIRARHLKTLRAMNARALEALKTYPLRTGWDGIRAAEAAVKLERLIIGEPTDRSAVSVENTIREEYERWMAEESDDDAGDESPETA